MSAAFKIRMIKPVLVRDRDGNVLFTYDVGDVIEAAGERPHYYIAGPGIYKDEAVRLEDPIDERFIQLSNN